MSRPLACALLLGWCTTTSPAQSAAQSPAAAEAPGAPDFVSLEGVRALADRSVFVALQSATGYLWAGTNDGLVRFDGLETKTWRHDPQDSTSLTNNTIRRLLEDPKGRLWIRTEATLDRFDPVTGRFTHYPLVAREMLFSQGGELLVAGPGGIHEYDEATDRFAPVVPAVPADRGGDGPAPNDPVWGFQETRDGSLWVSTEGGWLRHVSRDRRTSRWIRTPWRFVVLGYEEAGGALWLGHEGGVATFLPATSRSHPLALPFTGHVTAIVRANDGSVWVTGDRVLRVPFERDVMGEAQVARLPDAPLTRPIWWLFLDRQGIAWAASRRGLLYHDPWRSPVTVHPVPARGAERRARAAVVAVAEDGLGRVWTGSIGRGVEQLAPGDDVRGPTLGGRGACHQDVWALRWHRDRLWIGSAAGLCTWRIGAAQVEPVRLAEPGTGEPFVQVLATDGAGRLWVGTSAGLYAVDPDGWSARRVPLAIAGGVEGLTSARDGRLWIATSGGGLHRLDPATDRVERIPIGTIAALQGSEGFWSAIEERSATLLVGGDRGLRRVDPAAASVVGLEPVPTRSTTIVYAIAAANDGDLWLTTDLGLMRLRPEGTGFATRVFRIEGATPIEEFNRRAVTRTASGALLFGGMGGVIRFHPGRMVDRPRAAPMVVTAVERIRDGRVEAINPEGRRELVLPSDTRGFTIRFASLALTEAAGVTYRYRLHGIDDRWIPSTSDRLARYPALPPGRWTFEVRAFNGGVQEDTLTLPVTILAAWWETRAFQAAALAVVVLASFLVLRALSMRRLERTMRAMEVERRVHQERERISRDLHDHVGGQMASLVSGIELVQLSIDAGQHDRAVSYLGAVATEAGHTLGQLRETVWSLRTEGLSVRGLVERIDEFLQSRGRFLAAPTLRLDARVERDAPLTTATAMQLFRIVQEGVNNAIAHAGASNVEVSVRQSTGPKLVVEVRDDGHGPAPSATAHVGQGLAGMRARAREIGAELQWEGTTRGVVVRITVDPERVPGGGR